jgi:hypothetical protein
MAEILNVNWNSVFENMHNILPQENDSEFSIGWRCTTLEDQISRSGWPI